MHKAFIENGKAILNQDINTVFGEKTLYKNYETDNKNYYGDNRYIKSNRTDKSAFMNSDIEKDNDNNSLIYNNY